MGFYQVNILKYFAYAISYFDSLIIEDVDLEPACCQPVAEGSTNGGLNE